jgi:PIN domain nuclease of toxin-antitoxin system
MRLLLDAHALLWWLADDPALGPEARRAIADPVNEVLVSAATTWEISIKRALGKLEAPPGIDVVLVAEGFTEAPILAADGEQAGALPPHHRDPFDRMLVAQAMRLAAAIVTTDPAFELYGAAILPAGG